MDDDAARLDLAEHITVACEIKFLVACLPHGAEDPEPNDGRPILEAFQLDGGLDAELIRQVYSCIARSIQEVPGQRAVTSHTLAQDGLRERDFWSTGWIVKKANSAEPRSDCAGNNAYLWVPVEICAPKLVWKTPRMWPEIGAVLRKIKEMHRVMANYTCDVHVHVGRRDGRPFSLPMLKRLGSLLWLAETRLRSIRDPRSPNFHNVFTWGAELRLHSRLAQSLGSSPFPQSPRTAGGRLVCTANGTDVEPRASRCGRPLATSRVDHAALQAISRCGSYLGLGRLLSGPEKQFRRLGFNFSAFGEEDERARTGPRTVEFRILEGTLDEALVRGWMHICCVLVLVASDEVGSATWYRDVTRCLLRHGEQSTVEEFGALMDALRISKAIYAPFLEKIRTDQ